MSAHARSVFQFEVKRTKDDDEHFAGITFEEFSVSAADAGWIAVACDQDAQKDSVWLWDEPVLKYDQLMTP